MERFEKIRLHLETGDWLTPERMRNYTLLIGVMSAIGLAALWVTGDGLVDRFGRPIGTDFANPYTAGLMALDGAAADIFDFIVHEQVQRAFFGGGEDHPFYGWPYPPVFLIPATGLAMLPYLAALALYMGATGLFYLAAVRSILPFRSALIVAAAFPAVFVTVAHGQNAFLTAGLLGMGLALLERRPWIAGLLLGALCYKPHFGMVLPLVLAAGGYWRCFAGAAISVVILCLASLALFGPEPWHAFFASGEVTRGYVLEQVPTGWFKIQSAFSAVRGLGGAVELAYGLQAVVALGVLGGLAWLWWSVRSRPENLLAAKAATCSGALLLTPYVMDYDMLVLAPAVAFLVADGSTRGFRPYGKSLYAGIWLLPLIARPVAQYAHLPIGLIGMAGLFGFTLWTALRNNRAKAVPAAA
ncbi:MAG TPA: glycosyltransferase family 87 protein [Afifellaceae bacterium]|nr:glycosyltransferase family 87 protein [Afifellaceae bacterium]